MSETINIAKFFTKKNEEEGMPHKLYINGEDTGIVAYVYGVNSNAVTLANETYRKEMAEINSLKDPVSKAKKTDAAFAKRVAAFVKKFETANGEPLVIDGNPVTESDYVKIIDQSPLIARAILEFASDTEGFLDSEKNA